MYQIVEKSEAVRIMTTLRGMDRVSYARLGLATDDHRAADQIRMDTERRYVWGLLSSGKTLQQVCAETSICYDLISRYAQSGCPEGMTNRLLTKDDIAGRGISTQVKSRVAAEINTAAERYGIPPILAIVNPHRSCRGVYMTRRHVVVFVRDNYKYSWSRVAQVLGMSDHTSAIRAYRKGKSNAILATIPGEGREG